MIKKLDPLQVFDIIEVSPKLPYVYCMGNVKQISGNSYLPESMNNFNCMLCLTQLPVIKPKREITFKYRENLGRGRIDCQTSELA